MNTSSLTRYTNTRGDIIQNIHQHKGGGAFKVTVTVSYRVSRGRYNGSNKKTGGHYRSDTDTKLK